jgi:hypothetical protein
VVFIVFSTVVFISMGLWIAGTSVVTVYATSIVLGLRSSALGNVTRRIPFSSFALMEPQATPCGIDNVRLRDWVLSLSPTLCLASRSKAQNFWWSLYLHVFLSDSGKFELRVISVLVLVHVRWHGTRALAFSLSGKAPIRCETVARPTNGFRSHASKSLTRAAVAGLNRLRFIGFCRVVVRHTPSNCIARAELDEFRHPSSAQALPHSKLSSDPVPLSHCDTSLSQTALSPGSS